MQYTDCRIFRFIRDKRTYSHTKNTLQAINDFANINVLKKYCNIYFKTMFLHFTIDRT